VRRKGSPSQDASSTSSTNTSDQGQRPAAAGTASGSQNPTEASDGQKRPQKGSSQSATGSQDNQKSGSSAASQTTTDGQPRSTTGSAQQQNTQSGSASMTQQSGSKTQQSGTAGASSSTSSNAASANTTSNAVANLSTERRSEVTQAFTSTSVNTVSNVNFNVSVGTTITDEIHLAPLPAEVVRIVPQYRGYQYVVVRDEIVIVEPRTKKIVEVIHKSGGTRKSASVSLNSEQRAKFKTSVETTGSVRSPSASIELHQGEVLPEDMSLMDVPDTVITEVPELRTYRYVIVGDEIAIVEPDTRRVIEIIQ
jgi:hypothetical protein